MDTATSLLAEHGLQLDVTLAGQTLALDEVLIPGTEDMDAKMGRLVVNAARVDEDEGRQHDGTYLPVIIVPMREGTSLGGDENGEADLNAPAVFINANRSSVDRATLVHELGHIVLPLPGQPRQNVHDRQPPVGPDGILVQPEPLIFSVMCGNEIAGRDRRGMRRRFVERLARKGTDWLGLD